MDANTKTHMAVHGSHFTPLFPAIEKHGTLPSRATKSKKTTGIQNIIIDKSEADSVNKSIATDCL